MKVMWLAFLLLAPQESPEVAKARKTFLKSPEDPAANLTLGIFCAEANQWDLAIQHFRKSKHQEIQSAIETESKGDGSEFTTVEIGDAWSRASVKAGPARQACLDRMNHHYSVAWPKLSDLLRDQLRARVAKLYLPKVPSRGAKLPGALNGANLSVATDRVRSGGSSLKVAAKRDGRLASMGIMDFPLRGKKLDVSGWMSSVETDGAADKVKVAVLDAARKPLWLREYFVQANSPIWVRIGDVIDIPDGAVTLNLEILSNSTQGAFYIDDLSLKVDGAELLRLPLD